MQNGYDTTGLVTRTVLLFSQWYGSPLAAIPTPAGTRAGIDERWVTVPVTRRRHGRRHGRATEPIAEGWQFESQGFRHHCTRMS